ncbi:MAG TPA: OB-fold nucleic acid binding domain-containing protein [Patescibacteria group bacterium]|nr:OB-fold nucleic acid binding domain-containing protein [Patescibacteria group bacterium]
MAEQGFKRNIAYKHRIGDILVGKPVSDGERFAFLELGDKKIVRVNIVGNIVDKYENEGESKYLSITIDDGSGQIKLKTFADDVQRFRNFFQGQTVVIIGTLRIYNNELYISPEIIKEIDSRYLIIRKIELEKEKKKNFVPLQKNEIFAIKDKILEKIKNSEEEGGIETEKIILNLREAPSDIINQEIKKLLEEGIIFEPRPGKVRWLG